MYENLVDPRTVLTWLQATTISIQILKNLSLERNTHQMMNSCPLVMNFLGQKMLPSFLLESKPWGIDIKSVLLLVEDASN